MKATTCCATQHLTYVGLQPALVDFAVSAFVTLLVVVDPLGLVPSFISATPGFSEKDRDMVGLALFGDWVLRQRGIGLPAFQIAGGLLLFGVSYRMIFGDRPQKELRETGKAMSEHASDLAVFPVAIPLPAAPGSARDHSAALRQRPGDRAAVVLIVVVARVCAISAVCFSGPSWSHARWVALAMPFFSVCSVLLPFTSS
jgi:multiple antibiotic resistance protein